MRIDIEFSKGMSSLLSLFKQFSKYRIESVLGSRQAYLVPLEMLSNWTKMSFYEIWYLPDLLDTANLAPANCALTESYCLPSLMESWACTRSLGKQKGESLCDCVVSCPYPTLFTQTGTRLLKYCIQKLDWRQPVWYYWCDSLRFAQQGIVVSVHGLALSAYFGAAIYHVFPSFPILKLV